MARSPPRDYIQLTVQEIPGRSPETNGVIERFWKTLKKQVIESRIYRTLADRRKALKKFVDLYNCRWRLEKLGGRTPDEVR